LYTVNVLTDPTLFRNATDAVATYKQIIANGGVPAGYIPVMPQSLCNAAASISAFLGQIVGLIVASTGSPTVAVLTTQPPSRSPPSQSPLNQSPPSQSPLNQSPPSQSPLNQSPPSQSPLKQSPPSQSPLKQSPPSQSPLNQSPPSQSPLKQSPPSKSTQAPTSTTAAGSGDSANMSTATSGAVAGGVLGGIGLAMAAAVGFRSRRRRRAEKQEEQVRDSSVVTAPVVALQGVTKSNWNIGTMGSEYHNGMHHICGGYFVKKECSQGVCV